MYIFRLTLRFPDSRIHLFVLNAFEIKKKAKKLLQFLDSNVIEQNLTLLTGMDLQGKEAL